MQCVRCLRDTASKIAEAPDKSHGWELYFCTYCHYSWRNIEPDYITDIGKRDPWGQLDGKDIEAVKTITESEYRTTKEGPGAGNGR